MNFFEDIYNKILDPFNHDLVTFIQFMAIILVFLVLCAPLSKLIVKIVHAITNNKSKRIKESSFYRPVKWFFCLLGIFLASYTLNLSQEFSDFLHKVFKILCILLISKCFINLFSNKKKFNFLKNDKMKESKTLVSFFDKVIIMLIYIVTGFIVMYEMGYNLNGLVAGLGIGSAVIALAAQDLVKSLIASFVIITEKPFVVGDYIETDSFKGTVEDVTFRSTVVRTNDRSVVSIPSSKIAESYVLNWSRTGGKRRYDLDLGIVLDTPLKKVNEFMEHLKLELSKLDIVEKETINIHFTDIKADNINIYIYVYLNAKDYNEYLDMKEIVNYTIMGVAEREKVELAFPTNMVYVKK